MDPYSTLGVAVNATQDEIKKAYRTLVRQWHPDYNKSPEASVKFDAIQRAHDLLTRGSGFKATSFPHFNTASTPGWQRPTPPHSAAPSERMSKVVQASARKKRDTEQALAEHEVTEKRNLEAFKESHERIREAIIEAHYTTATLIKETRESAQQRLKNAQGNYNRVVEIAAERDERVMTLMGIRDQTIDQLADDILRLQETYYEQMIAERDNYSKKLDAISLQFLNDTGVPY